MIKLMPQSAFVLFPGVFKVSSVFFWLGGVPCNFQDFLFKTFWCVASAL